MAAFMKWGHLLLFVLLVVKPWIKHYGWYDTATILRNVAQICYLLPVISMIQFANFNGKGAVFYELFEPTTFMFWTITDVVFFPVWIFAGMCYLAFANIFKVKYIFKATAEK